MERSESPSPPLDARLAAAALAGLVVFLPWPMGGAWPEAERAATLFTLGLSAALLVGRLRATRALSPAPLGALYALAAVAALQLLPLPPALHERLAAGSAALWHPTGSTAAAVLGEGFRPLSVHPPATRSALGFVLGLATLGLLALPALRERRTAPRIVAAAVAGGLLVAIYGVGARLLYGPLLFGRIAVPTVSPFGPFVSKNHFAAYVAAIGLLSLGLAVGMADEARREKAWLSWVRSPRAPRIVVALGATFALVLAVPAAQSRGGALGLVAGLAVFFVLRTGLSSGGRGLGTRAAVALGLFAGLALATALLLPAEARGRLLTLLQAPDRSGSFRLRVWRDSGAAFRASPALGYGLGTFADALPRHKTGAGELRVEHAESEPVELLVETGLGSVVVLGLGVLALFRGARAARARRGMDRGLVLGGVSAVTGLAVHGLVDFPLHLPAAAAAGLTAFVLAAGGDPAESALPARVGRPIGAVLLVALLAAFGSRWTSPAVPPRARDLPALRFAVAGERQLLPRARATQAEAALRVHLRSRPADAEGWLYLAWLRARAGERTEGAALARHAVSLDPLLPGAAAFVKELEERAAKD